MCRCTRACARNSPYRSWLLPFAGDVTKNPATLFARRLQPFLRDREQVTHWNSRRASTEKHHGLGTGHAVRSHSSRQHNLCYATARVTDTRGRARARVRACLG